MDHSEVDDIREVPPPDSINAQEPTNDATVVVEPETNQAANETPATEAASPTSNPEPDGAPGGATTKQSPFSGSASSVGGNTTSLNEPLLQRIGALKERIAVRKARLAELDATLHNAASAGDGKEQLDADGFALVPPELLKSCMQQHQQASREVSELDRQKAKTKPEYDLVLKNAHVREEHSRMQAEAADKEEKVAAAEEASIALESQLGEASRKYKAEVKKRDQYIQEVLAAISDLQFTVRKKLILVTTVDPTEEAYLPEAQQAAPEPVTTAGPPDLHESSVALSDANERSHLSTSTTPDRAQQSPTGGKASAANEDLIPEYIRKALPRPAPEEYVPILADDLIELTSDAVRTRDRQIGSLLKLKREHESMRQLNAAKLDSMRNEGNEQAQELLRQKDEAIRAAVYQFQNERNKLHVDIEDMRKINVEQGEALKNGQRRVAPEKGGFGRKAQDNSVKAEARERLRARIDDLRATVEDLQDEANRLQSAIRDGTKTKAQLLRDDKLLDLRIKRDAENQRLALANLDSEIEGANMGLTRTERECDKLAAMVKTLSQQVSFLKEESDANHGARTRPLPE